MTSDPVGEDLDVLEDAEYRAFRTSVKMARASSESDALAVIRQAARDGTWQAAAWYLERSNPRRWGKVARFKAEITARGDARPLVSAEVRERVLTDPGYAELACKLAALMARPQSL